MQRRQNLKKIWKQKSGRTGEKFGFVYLSSVFFFISGFVCAKAGFGRTSCGGKITAFPDTGTPFALAVVSEGPACGAFAGRAAKIADCGVGGMGVRSDGDVEGGRGAGAKRHLMSCGRRAVLICSSDNS